MKSYELKPTSENLLTTFQDDMIGRNAVVKALQLRIYHHLRFLKIILSLSPPCGAKTHRRQTGRNPAVV